MRKRKYRAWDKVQEEFIYSDQVAGGMWRYFKLLEDRGIRHFESEDWTGLLDKNGKEIYEGDIVRHWDKFPSEINLQVVWHDSGFYFAWTDGLINHILRGTEFFEVIGNIHENPELVARAG